MCNTQSNMLEILTTIIVTVTSFAVIIQTVQISTKKDLFLKIYFPFYRILSPFLYKKLTTEELQIIIKEANNIFSASDYVPFFITERIERLQEGLLKNEVYQITYIELCRHIDKHCNKLCFLLGYPRRNLKYRLNHNQFSSKVIGYLAFALFAIARLVIAIIIVIFGVAFCAWLLLLVKNALQILR